MVLEPYRPSSKPAGLAAGALNRLVGCPVTTMLSAACDVACCAESTKRRRDATVSAAARTASIGVDVAHELSDRLVSRELHADFHRHARIRNLGRGAATDAMRSHVRDYRSSKDALPASFYRAAFGRFASRCALHLHQSDRCPRTRTRLREDVFAHLNSHPRKCISVTRTNHKADPTSRREGA